MPSLSSTTSESQKLMLTRSRHSIISIQSLDSSTGSITSPSLAESRHINQPSHKAREAIYKPESDHRHGHRVKKPVRLLIVIILLTICGLLQAYYSRHDSIDEHAECARRYRRLNDKYEELKEKFSDLRYF
jgi:hypothetical protein